MFFHYAQIARYQFGTLISPTEEVFKYTSKNKYITASHSQLKHSVYNK